MRISTKSLSFSQLAVDILVVPVSAELLKDVEKKKCGSSSRGKVTLAKLNTQFGGGLVKSLEREGFSGKEGEVSVFKSPTKEKCPILIVVGWSPKKPSLFGRIERYRKFGALLTKQAKKYSAAKVAVATELFDFSDDRIIALIEGLNLGQYEFTQYKSEKKKEKAKFSEVILLTDKKIGTKQSKYAKVVSEGTMLARDLINTPPLDCSPAYLVKTCRAIAKKGDLKIQVYDKVRLAKMGANLILAVNKGSDIPPYMVKMTYKPKRKNPKVISIVGKGITFDSGGLSIKSAAGMMDMKGDMGGAAAIIGAMQAIAALKPSVEVRAYVPTTENMINGKATRPSDVVTALNGKTVEILNTDAEGRLILADALSLASKEGADSIIDLATLTGSVCIALGLDYAGLFSSDPDLSDAITDAAEKEGELLWELPLAEEYRGQLKSKVADLRNIGAGRWGGSITAALFLSEFVDESIPWAHLDIAGTSSTEKPSGYLSHFGVGYGVRTLVRYVLDQ